MKGALIFPPLLLAVVCALAAGGLLTDQPAGGTLAGYATSLSGRTVGQRHNAQLAAQALHGRSIPPGAVFSFNQVLRGWSADQGYVKAPVSYDGELLRAHGGGVCQTSTTLYNAVLLAGLPLVERHPHQICPQYVTPGRDAAVAYPGVDLRFSNSFPWPLRLWARAEHDRLEVRILAPHHRAAELPQVSLQTKILDRAWPQRLTQLNRGHSGRAWVRSPGAAGYRVVTYRIIRHGNEPPVREQLSDDTYPVVQRVIALGP